MSDDEGSQAEEEEQKYSIQFEGDEEAQEYCDKDGKAQVNYENGDAFDGDINNCQKNGQGKYTWSALNNASFDGHWIDDVISTRGKFVLPDGSVYEGCVERGQRHGQGKMTYANGDVFEGDWVYGKREGAAGTYTFAGSQSCLSGAWKDDQFVGDTWAFKDGTTFFGAFNAVTNQPVGQGKFVFGNGHEMTGFYDKAGQWVPQETVYVG